MRAGDDRLISSAAIAGRNSLKILGRALAQLSLDLGLACEIRRSMAEQYIQATGLKPTEFSH
jgi:hypothetical protein